MDDDLLRDLDDLDDNVSGEEEDAHGEVTEGQGLETEGTSIEEALLASVAGAKDIQSIAKLSRSKHFQETLGVCPL